MTGSTNNPETIVLHAGHRSDPMTPAAGAAAPMERPVAA